MIIEISSSPEKLTLSAPKCEKTTNQKQIFICDLRGFQFRSVKNPALIYAIYSFFESVSPSLHSYIFWLYVCKYMPRLGLRVYACIMCGISLTKLIMCSKFSRKLWILLGFLFAFSRNIFLYVLLANTKIIKYQA